MTKSKKTSNKSKLIKKVKSKSSKLKKTILGIAIALVLVFFWGYSVNTFYEEPDREEFCKGIEYRLDVDSCEGYSSQEVKESIPVPVRGDKDCYCYEIDKEGNKKCDATNPKYTKCMDEFDEEREKHGRFSFIVLVILGLLSILIGGILLKVESVSSGIMGGGVLTLLYAAMRFWGSIQDYGRLLVLAIALIVLVWIGYKKLKD